MSWFSSTNMRFMVFALSFVAMQIWSRNKSVDHAEIKSSSLEEIKENFADCDVNLAKVGFENGSVNTWETKTIAGPEIDILARGCAAVYSTVKLGNEQKQLLWSKSENAEVTEVEDKNGTKAVITKELEVLSPYIARIVYHVTLPHNFNQELSIRDVVQIDQKANSNCADPSIISGYGFNNGFLEAKYYGPLECYNDKVNRSIDPTRNRESTRMPYGLAGFGLGNYLIGLVTADSTISYIAPAKDKGVRKMIVRTVVNPDHKSISPTKNPDETPIGASSTSKITRYLVIAPQNLNVMEDCAARFKIPAMSNVICYGRLGLIVRVLVKLFNSIFELLKKAFSNNIVGFSIILMTIVARLVSYIVLKEQDLGGMSSPAGMEIAMHSQKSIILWNSFSKLSKVLMFFALMKTIHILPHFDKSSFFWCSDLSMPDRWSLLTLGGRIKMNIPQILSFGLLPLLFSMVSVISSAITNSRTNLPQNMKDSAKNMQMILTIPMVLIMQNFASGLLLYFVVNELISVFEAISETILIDAKQEKISK